MESKMKHTPGSWVVKDHDMGTFIYCDKGYLICGPVSERPDGKSNGRLIAAAPDLLEALICIDKEMVDGHGFPLEDGEMFALDKVRAAIAKATGAGND